MSTEIHPIDGQNEFAAGTTIRLHCDVTDDQGDPVAGQPQLLTVTVTDPVGTVHDVTETGGSGGKYYADWQSPLPSDGPTGRHVVSFTWSQSGRIAVVKRTFRTF